MVIISKEWSAARVGKKSRSLLGVANGTGMSVPWLIPHRRKEGRCRNQNQKSNRIILLHASRGSGETRIRQFHQGGSFGLERRGHLEGHQDGCGIVFSTLWLFSRFVVVECYGSFGDLSPRVDRDAIGSRSAS